MQKFTSTEREQCSVTEAPRVIIKNPIGTAPPGKHDFLRARGLDHAIDSRAANWDQQVSQLTKGEGVQVILDAQGGPTWRANYRLLAPTGRLLTFGVSSLARGHRRSWPALLRFVLS